MGSSISREIGQLIKALDWCLCHHTHNIHSTRSVNRLVAQGSSILAACNNSGAYKTPACLSGVIRLRFYDSLVEPGYKENAYYMEEATVFGKKV